jgi:4-hydroxythreonine-4-phosphate dehydrogenase
MTARRPRIAITMGDPLGIGPEIVAACVPDPSHAADLLVIGDAPSLAAVLARTGGTRRVRKLTAPEACLAAPDSLDVLTVGDDLPPLSPGHVDARAGRASFSYVEHAIDLALAGRVDAIVTAPINKAAWSAAGITFPGHTELLAARTGVDEFAMMLFNDDLRVVLVSIHVPLRDAIGLVTPERELRTIRLAHQALRDLGVAAPRVAVAGLNPHAGEGGLFGTEDAAVIAPAVAQARGLGIDASGPWPPDTVFMQARQGRFDVVVAQYHDQGLIPVKYLGVDTGVNMTLGLPFVRTSVDHGTAFDIAGKGMADASSLRIAIREAVRMSRRRLPASIARELG